MADHVIYLDEDLNDHIEISTYGDNGVALTVHTGRSVVHLTVPTEDAEMLATRITWCASNARFRATYPAG